jgi:hypothetical protein
VKHEINNTKKSFDQLACKHLRQEVSNIASAAKVQPKTSAAIFEIKQNLSIFSYAITSMAT